MLWQCSVSLCLSVSLSVRLSIFSVFSVSPSLPSPSSSPPSLHTHRHHHHFFSHIGPRSTRTATANDTQRWSACVSSCLPRTTFLTHTRGLHPSSLPVCLPNHRGDSLSSPRPTTSTSALTIRHVRFPPPPPQHHHLHHSSSTTPPPRPPPQFNLRHSTTPPPPQPHFLPPLPRRHLVSFSLLPLPPSSLSHLLFLYLSHRVPRLLMLSMWSDLLTRRQMTLCTPF